MQSYQKLNQLIAVLNLENNYMKALQQASDKYNFDENELKLFSPDFVLQQLNKVEFDHNNPPLVANEDQESISNLLGEYWGLNENKLFSWIVICYFYTLNKEIDAYDLVDLTFICSIFPNKNAVFIQFNLLSLLKQVRSKRETWCVQELTLLRQITKQQKYKQKWKLISYALFCRSDKKYFRTSHKCRQKWYNYLNPIVNHQKWTIQEDCELFKHAGEYGQKWAKISKAMNQVRTVDMVKNRFNSIVKKFGSRFPRCSKKKIIQRIGQILQDKLLTEKQVFSSLQKNEQVILKIEASSVKFEQQQKNKIQIISQPQKVLKSESESESSDEENEYNTTYVKKTSEKVEEKKREDIHNLVEVKQINIWLQGLTRAVHVLQDYTDIDIQNKKTYFSGNL